MLWEVIHIVPSGDVEYIPGFDLITQLPIFPCDNGLLLPDTGVGEQRPSFCGAAARRASGTELRGASLRGARRVWIPSRLHTRSGSSLRKAIIYRKCLGEHGC